MAIGFANANGRAVLVDGDAWYDIAALTGDRVGPDPMVALTAAPELRDLADGLSQHDPGGTLADIELGPPIPRPRNSFGIGLNYVAHAEEFGLPVPDEPLVFTKFPSCLAGPRSEVRLRGDTVDYEGELVVVIGTTGKDIAEGRAWDHVFGVTVGQDISDRTQQNATDPPQFSLGKSFDTYGPIGPVVVSPDLLPDRDDLRVTTDVNGRRRQDDTTANMIFSVSELISYLSHIVTLSPGDLIFTGTPAGTGSASDDYLVDGDVITTTIAGIGTLENRCVLDR